MSVLILLNVFIKYVLVGGLAVGVHLLILLAGIEAGLSPTLATSIGFIVGSCVNYALQKSWVFRYKAQFVASFSRYVGVTAAMCVVNMVIFNILLPILINALVAQAVATMIVMLLNFAINSAFTFAPSRQAPKV